VPQREGYETVSAGVGLTAIKELEKQEFDVVLTDMSVQPVDGFQVLDRASELYPGIEVIVITGYASISTILSTLCGARRKIGVDRWLRVEGWRLLAEGFGTLPIASTCRVRL
jgi:CheY-like chemotaxis protein